MAQPHDPVKEKAGKERENGAGGLFAYPCLMAADILAYKATHVPVGEDQKQHLELTRDVAQKFNTDFGREVFPLPEPLIFGAATRVMSLRDGSKKMSKSDPSDYSRINMTDDADAIALKIRKAKTDPNPLPEAAAGLAERPEAANLLGIYAALTGQSLDSAVAECAGMRFRLQGAAGRGGGGEAGADQRRDGPAASRSGLYRRHSEARRREGRRPGQAGAARSLRGGGVPATLTPPVNLRRRTAGETRRAVAVR